MKKAREVWISELPEGYTGWISLSKTGGAHKFREVLPDEQSKIEVLVSAIKESISRSDDSGDSYNSQPIREALKEIEELK